MRDPDQITGMIVDSAVRLHKRLGPGLLESVYADLLTQDLSRRGLQAERGRAITFRFDGLVFRDRLRPDLLVEEIVLVELKSVEAIAPVHWKQVLTYLRLLDLRVGLLLNFGAATMKQGIHRVVNRYVPPRSG